MRLASLGSVLLGLSLLSACGEQKIVEQQRDDQILSAKPEVKPVTEANAEPKIEPIVREMEKPAADSKSLYQKYPVRFVVESIPTTAPGQPLYFGYHSGSPRPSQAVFFYLVAAVPDFLASDELPVFESQQDIDLFMSLWSAEFVKDTVNSKKLDELAKSFQWTVDPNYIDQQAVSVDPRILEGEPDYVRLTQRTLARRFTFKAEGMSSIRGKNGVQEIEIPVVITAHQEASRALGEQIYKGPNTDCISCHMKNGPFGELPFLKHSTEYLSFYSDQELLNIIKNAKYPDGGLVLDGEHKFSLASVDEEQGIIAYLRNSRSFYDLLLELLGTMSLNLRSSLQGWF